MLVPDDQTGRAAVSGVAVAALARAGYRGDRRAPQHVLALREAGAVDGVHLVPVSRAAAVARRLTPLLADGT